MDDRQVLVTGSNAAQIASQLRGHLPNVIIHDELHCEQEKPAVRKQNNYDKHHPLCSNGYNFGKHKRGATSAQQTEYISDAAAKRARKNAKRAKENGHAS